MKSAFLIPALFFVFSLQLVAAPTYSAVNYGAASGDELDAFNRINAFRADPTNALYGMFVERYAYGETKPVFDALLNGQTTHTPNWWANTFGGDIVTWSMDASGTVPETLNTQFGGLSSQSAYIWNDNIGWAAHQYATWVEVDAGMSPNPHAVTGAPTLGNRFTEAGVAWSNIGENIARDWDLDTMAMHMGFAIDWGPGTDGIQDPPGHRNSMLSPIYTELGIGIVDEQWNPGKYTQVQHFANVNSTSPIFYGYVFEEDDGAGMAFTASLVDAESPIELPTLNAQIAGVTVTIYDAGNNPIGSDVTDALGAYTIINPSGTPESVVFETPNGDQFTTSAFGSSGNNYFLDAFIPIPEPSSFTFLLGSLGLLARSRRR